MQQHFNGLPFVCSGTYAGTPTVCPEGILRGQNSQVAPQRACLLLFVRWVFWVRFLISKTVKPPKLDGGCREWSGMWPNVIVYIQAIFASGIVTQSGRCLARYRKWVKRRDIWHSFPGPTRSPFAQPSRSRLLPSILTTMQLEPLKYHLL